MRIRHIIACAICIIFIFVTSLHGEKAYQSLERRLGKIYGNKIFIIRNFYTGNHLKFDRDGVLISGGRPGPWTLNGFFKLEELTLKKKKIILWGRRLFWSYDSEKKISNFFRSPDRIRIEINRGDEPQDISSFYIAFPRIFASDTESLQDLVPSYWKWFVRREFGGQDKSNNMESPWPDYTPTISTVQPKALSKIFPAYPSLAKIVKVEGKLLISVIVKTDGSVTVQHIINPLGIGLEESALKALSEWKFEPAAFNGTPVNSTAYIEFNFRLH